MGDSNFRKNMSRIFSKVLPEDVIARKFKQQACHLCKVEFHDEKAAWKHYYGSYHGDKMKRLPKMEKAPEFWVMILKSLEAFDPNLISKNELVDYMVDRFDVRESFSMGIIHDKVDTNIAEMVDYFQTVKKTERNLFGLKQRGRQELQKVSGKRFLAHENNMRREDGGRVRDSLSDRKRSGDDQRDHDQENKRRRQDKDIRSSRDLKQERRTLSEASNQKDRAEAVKAAAEDKRKPSDVSRNTPSPKDSRKTPSPNDSKTPVSPSELQKQLQHQYLQACQQQLLHAPQQPGQTRPIIILPPNLNLSSLPQNLISSLGPALTQMLPPQQLQSYPMMFPYTQQFQGMPTSTSSPKPLSPTMTSTTTTPSKPQLSPSSHFKNLVQSQQQAEATRTVRI